MRVKLCGFTRAEDVTAAVRAGADALGVVVDVSVDTPREVTVERARDLVAGVPPFVSTVLVTMATDPERVVELAETVGVDAVQLHADIPPADVRAVGERGFDVLAVVDATDDDAARRADAADALLVDSTNEAGGGGTGRTHDWERTAALVADLDTPVVLAGGLTPANVGDAVAAVEPYGVDVASGVERAGGVKDHDALAAFVTNARGAGAT
jgi:phosphoribosylanthranilate isomerase